MWNSIKNNWINILGGTFIFTAILYLFKLAFDQGWVIPEARIAIGFVIGVTALYVGYLQYQKKNILGSELVGGLGSAIIFATLSYAGFSSDITWSDNALLIAMGAFTGLIAFAGYKLDLRKVSFISILGGLICPLVLKAPEEQIFILYSYVFLLNVVALYLSGMKDWKELRVMSFLGTLVIYISYYMYFDPIGWQEPTFYLSSLFMVYFIGLLLISTFRDNEFEGLNLYMSVLNAINFVFWSVFIFTSFEVSYAIPSLIVSVLFIGAALFMFRRSPDAMIAPVAFFIMGIVLAAMAGGDLANQFRENGLNYVINTGIWLILLTAFYSVCNYKSFRIGRDISVVAWITIFLYWYAVAWQVEWIKLFGLAYIPFINPGAIVWMLLAATGFYLSRVYHSTSLGEQHPGTIKMLERVSLVMAILSHLVLGGLLTIQIQNTWDAYNLTFIQDHVMMSISFAVYALALFLWGAYNDQTPFRILGSTVLVITAIKVFLIDLQESSTIYMVLFLLLLGVLTLAIARIDKMWRQKPNKLESQES